jgi:hypothetical protein
VGSIFDRYGHFHGIRVLQSMDGWQEVREDFRLFQIQYWKKV